jgi:glyoxylase-like metal-dependent hydrolase (beta-lactamase superfamily II)
MSRKDAVMRKESVLENIPVYLYTFTYHDDRHANTVTVIIQNRLALIIDPSYPEYAVRVKLDLEKQGIVPKVIVLSHYHPDHVSGCAVFTGCDIYASEFYPPNYDNCQVWEPGFTYSRPNKLIKGKDSLFFGKVELKFFQAPGHSKCSLITVINGKVFHIGDLIMITWDRKNSLPYIADGGDFDDHIKSLWRIIELDPDAVIIPHGGWVDNKSMIMSLVEDRLFYLEKTLSSHGSLPLERCLKNDNSWYDQLEFHDFNLVRL